MRRKQGVILLWMNLFCRLLTALVLAGAMASPASAAGARAAAASEARAAGVPIPTIPGLAFSASAFSSPISAPALETTLIPAAASVAPPTAAARQTASAVSAVPAAFIPAAGAATPGAGSTVAELSEGRASRASSISDASDGVHGGENPEQIILDGDSEGRSQFDGAASARASGDSLPGPEASPENVTLEKVLGWTPEDFHRRGGKSIRVAYRGEVVEQQIVPISAYGKHEAALISRLAKLSDRKKFRRRNYAHSFREYDAYKSMRTLQEFSAILARVAKHPVEIGAWRITLKDGRIRTAIHTSSDGGSIVGSDIAKALGSLLTDISPADLAALQFFHTHPMKSAPLSPGDWDLAVDYRRWLSDRGIYIPFSMYAILPENDLMTFRTVP